MYVCARHRDFADSPFRADFINDAGAGKGFVKPAVSIILSSARPGLSGSDGRLFKNHCWVATMADPHLLPGKTNSGWILPARTRQVIEQLPGRI